jgi:hypothetical protein
MRRIFMNDLHNSQEITLDIFMKRSFMEYLLEWFFYRFRNLL